MPAHLARPTQGPSPVSGRSASRRQTCSDRTDRAWPGSEPSHPTSRPAPHPHSLWHPAPQPAPSTTPMTNATLRVPTSPRENIRRRLSGQCSDLAVDADRQRLHRTCRPARPTELRHGGLWTSRRIPVRVLAVDPRPGGPGRGSTGTSWVPAKTRRPSSCAKTPGLPASTATSKSPAAPEVPRTPRSGLPWAGTPTTPARESSSQVPPGYLGPLAGTAGAGQPTTARPRRP